MSADLFKRSDPEQPPKQGYPPKPECPPQQELGQPTPGQTEDMIILTGVSNDHVVPISARDPYGTNKNANTEPSDGGVTRVIIDLEKRFGYNRVVFSIYLIQFIVSVGVAIWFQYREQLKAEEIFFIFAVMYMSAIAMRCCESVRRTAPYNFIVLGLFTLTESCVAGIVVLEAPPALILTVVAFLMCIGLTRCDSQTKRHCTMFGGVLVVIIFGLVLFDPFDTIGHRMQPYILCGLINFYFYMIAKYQIVTSICSQSISSL